MHQVEMDALLDLWKENRLVITIKPSLSTDSPADVIHLNRIISEGLIHPEVWAEKNYRVNQRLSTKFVNEDQFLQYQQQFMDMVVQSYHRLPNTIDGRRLLEEYLEEIDRRRKMDEQSSTATGSNTYNQDQ